MTHASSLSKVVQGLRLETSACWGPALRTQGSRGGGLALATASSNDRDASNFFSCSIAASYGLSEPI
jgi:hypothetical protein